MSNFVNNPFFPIPRAYSYYHMGIKPGLPWVTRHIHDQLGKYFSANGDWFRYASQNYVIWTHLTPLEIANGIRATQGLETLIMFITPFQVDWANGYMPQEFWDWLKKNRFPPRLQYPIPPTIPDF